MLQDTFTPYHKKDVTCIFCEGVICEDWTNTPYSCDKCGHNPDVSDLRKAAIKLGDKRFLRLSVRDYEKFMKVKKK